MAAELVPKEFEGNIYLANVEDKPTTSGVLKVYTQGEWNLVCYRMNGKVVMNNAAAATACRQLGHPTVIDGGLQPAEWVYIIITLSALCTCSRVIYIKS